MGVVGGTGIEVSELGLGGAPLGNLFTAIDDATAATVVHAAWDAGIRYFDTAPHYGLGLSERRLGSALSGLPRSQYVVSTKVGRLLEPNPAPTGSDLESGGFDVLDDTVRVFDYSRDGILRSLDSSLRRLGLDRVDIVYIHDPDDHMDQAIGEAVPTLVRLREQGVVGAVGAGMNAVSPLSRFVAEADIDVVMIAGRWTLLDRSAEDLLAQCSARGISAVAAAPFNSGLLARRRPEPTTHFDYREVPAELLDAAIALADVCEAHGVQLPHAAMQFPLRHQAVVCVVAGMRSLVEVAEDARWAGNPVPDGLWGALEAVRSPRYESSGGC